MPVTDSWKESNTTQWLTAPEDDKYITETLNIHTPTYNWNLFTASFTAISSLSSSTSSVINVSIATTTTTVYVVVDVDGDVDVDATAVIFVI